MKKKILCYIKIISLDGLPSYIFKIVKNLEDEKSVNGLNGKTQTQSAIEIGTKGAGVCVFLFILLLKLVLRITKRNPVGGV